MRKSELDIINSIKPKNSIKASESLRLRVYEKLSDYKSSHNDRRLNIMTGTFSMAVAASLIVILVISPSLLAHSPQDILNDSVEALNTVSSFEMDLEIKTTPHDNFRHIDVSLPSVNHKLYVETTDSTVNWSIQKSGRCAMHIGNTDYMWFKNLNYCYYSDNSNWDILGYLAVLLSPGRVLEKEVELAANQKDSSIKVKKDGDRYLIEIHSLPSAHTNHPILQNSSVEFSESVRRYVIDAKTKLLKSASISIITDSKENDIIKIDSIRYLANKKNYFELPEGVALYELNSCRLEGLEYSNPHDATEAILNAFTLWDLAILSNVLEAEEIVFFEPILKGCEVISVGRPLEAEEGLRLVFVPYSIRLTNGEIKSSHLSLSRNDGGKWIIEGGI